MNENKMSIYRILVDGHLRENWADWLNGMVISIERLYKVTAITLDVPDQAALRGILNKLFDLNLTLLSVDLQGNRKTGDKNEI